MMYPFLTLSDNTEITHSGVLEDGRVKVYIETPDEKDCFHHMACYLPDYEITDVSGFSEEEVSKYTDRVKAVAHLIFEFAQSGGFENASGF